MRLLHSLVPLPSGHPGYVATIGGFDGIHRGHRVLIDRTLKMAQSAAMDSMMITFEPLPREFFARSDPPARLTTFRERWRLLEHGGPDVFCVLHFSQQLRNLAARDFAAALTGAGIRRLIIGHDFRAARDGYATAEWFQKEGPNLGLEVDVVPPVTDAAQRISSRAVRAALACGDLVQAGALLGRRYSMVGRVIEGQKLGRTLGFPTANLRLGRRRSPMDGIFAVRVRGVGSGHAPDKALPGVASLGTRPTVGGTVPLLEAHVFEFEGDLYGREIEVEFVARLRDELKFDSVDAMVEQMHRDAADARAALRTIRLN
jgi:riboflavin kinase/FMN adenylyltransferase